MIGTTHFTGGRGWIITFERSAGYNRHYGIVGGVFNKVSAAEVALKKIVAEEKDRFAKFQIVQITINDPATAAHKVEQRVFSFFY